VLCQAAAPPPAVMYEEPAAQPPVMYEELVQPPVMNEEPAAQPPVMQEELAQPPAVMYEYSARASPPTCVRRAPSGKHSRTTRLPHRIKLPASQLSSDQCRPVRTAAQPRANHSQRPRLLGA
jgi:hypothetical protein